MLFIKKKYYIKIIKIVFWKSNYLEKNVQNNMQ